MTASKPDKPSKPASKEVKTIKEVMIKDLNDPVSKIEFANVLEVASKICPPEEIEEFENLLEKDSEDMEASVKVLNILIKWHGLSHKVLKNSFLNPESSKSSKSSPEIKSFYYKPNHSIH